MNSNVEQGFFRVVSASRGEIKSLLEGLEEFLASQGVDQDASRRVVIVAQELLQNALEHGVFRLAGKEQLLETGKYETALSRFEREFRAELIELNCERRSAEVLIRVECNGEPFLWQSGEPQMLSGRGLTLVKGLCDAFSIDSQRNLVTATLRI